MTNREERTTMENNKKTGIDMGGVLMLIKVLIIFRKK
jgi:hypothetical protein